jgi:hypothetical protein
MRRQRIKAEGAGYYHCMRFGDWGGLCTLRDLRLQPVYHGVQREGAGGMNGASPRGASLRLASPR